MTTVRDGTPDDRGAGPVAPPRSGEVYVLTLEERPLSGQQAEMERAVRDVLDKVEPGQPFHIAGVSMVYIEKGDGARFPGMPATLIRDAKAPEEALSGLNLDGEDDLLGQKWMLDGDAAARDAILAMPDGKRRLAGAQAWHDNWHANRLLLRRRTARDGTIARGSRSRTPLFIVGNGPSLAGNGHLLDRIDPDRAMVLFTNRVPAGLDVAGRYYGCIDWLGAEPDGRLFAEDLPHGEMNAMFDLFVPNHVTSRPWRRRFWSRYSAPQSRYCRQMKREFPWITPSASWLVSVYTWLFLGIVWECPAIVFVGQDLALSADKVLHFSGDKVDGDVPEITDINGQATYTTMNFFRASLCVQAQMELQRFLKAQFPDRHCPRFINATEGGIVKHGCTQMSLSEAIDTLGVAR